MAAYKVINLDSPIESDYWVDIPVRDPATNKDAVDEKGRILVQRHVTRSIKNEELSTFNTAVETLNTLKVDYSTFKEEVSTKVNRHDSNILTNTNNITTLTDSVNNHDLQINALYTKINAIQGIDIDDFKYVTETDIKNIKKNYLPLAGGTVTGNVVFAGSVSSNSPIKANLQGTADRAIGDINGKALTSYFANLKVSGASLTVTNGAGKASNYIIDNVNHATHAISADSATNATNCTSKVNSSLATYTYLNGNQGNVLVNSNASAGEYTMLTKLNSTNGKFTQGCYRNDYLLQYTTNATVNAGTNSVTKSVTLLNENGDSTFCGVVTAPTFKGALSGNATNATKASQNASGYALANTIVKSIAISGRTITVTKIDGTSYTLTTQDTNTTYTKLSQFANDVGFITSAGSCAHATTADSATRASSATNANNLGGYPASNYVRRVNGNTPDKQGNVQLDGLVKSVNGVNADASGNVTINADGCIPNYSAKIDIDSSNLKYTAPTKGILYVGSYAGTKASVTVKINNILFANSGWGPTVHEGEHKFITNFILDKGDEATWTFTGGVIQGTTFNFFPFK